MDKLVRRTRESFVAFGDLPLSDSPTCDHLQVMHADTGWHILRNGNVLARCPSLRHASRRARHAAIHMFVASKPELLWLHAGAVTRGGKAILFVGESGAGKSTFVVELCRRGWSYISDDVVPIDSGNGSAIPFPLTPSVRAADDSGEDVSPDYLGPGKKWDRRPLDVIAQEPCPIETIVLLEYSASRTARLEPLTPRYAEALLTESVLNHSIPGGAAYRMLTDLAFEKPAWKFRHSGDPASLDEILKLIDPFPETVAV